MKRKHHLVTAGGIGIVVVIVVVLTGLGRRGGYIGLSNGGFVRITCSRDNCRLFYQSRDGETGTIAFVESSILQLDEAHVAFIAPAPGGKCLLILYDADVHYRLVRVDPTRPFNKFPENSYLSHIVHSSPWKIEEGTSNDWEEVCSYLKTVSQNTFNQQAATKLDLGIARFHYQREELVSEVERQIYNCFVSKIYG